MSTTTNMFDQLRRIPAYIKVSKSIVIIPEKRNEVYDELLKAVYEAMCNQTMTEDQIQDSTEYILEGLEKVTSLYELEEFLLGLSAHWSCYHPVWVKYLNQIKALREIYGDKC